MALAVLASFSCTQPSKTGPVEADWGEPVFPGVWKTQVGTPDKLNLLNATGADPRAEALDVRTEQDFPIDPAEIKTTLRNGKVVLRLPLDKDEQIFGLGLNFKTIDQRGRIMRLHMDHYGKEDNGRTHAPVPFFVSSKGYGLLINAARYIDVYVGTGVRLDSKNPPEVYDRNTDSDWKANPYSDNLEFVIPASGAELILFRGDDVLDVVSRFNLYCGGGFIPPKWGLGFWQRTPTRYSDQQVKEEAAQFEEKDFPLDVVGLEPGWHSKAYPCSFDWDPGRYPDPDSFIQEMKGMNLNVNLWCNPYLSPESPIYEEMLPYNGTHTVWCGTVPDYTIPEAREIFRKHIRKAQIDKGVSGYKMDEVDGRDSWLWTDAAEFPSGTEADQMRSVYGNLMMKTIDKVYRDVNRRTYGLVRGVNAGGVSMPYVIYNDNYSHKDFITAISNSSFIGVMWTPEVRRSDSGEEWLRRMQTACFGPIAMINAWADGTKPWSYPEVYAQCQDVAFLRMRLLPYLYSAFAAYYLEGEPPFRAMNMVDGYDGKTQRLRTELDATDNPYETVQVREVKDQYMVGDNLLVAPVFAGETGRSVILPKGKWYDFYTGEFVGEDEMVRIKASMDRIPLFVRDGGIIPMVPAARQTKAWIDGLPLELRVYGTADGAFELYDDDGESYDYENGEYSVRRFSVRGGEPSVEVVKDGLWSYKDISWTFMTKK